MPIKIITSLKERLKNKLPAWEAQKTMSPLDTSRYLDINTASKKAAVLALLYLNETGDLNIIYIKRPSHNPHDKHGGQISFPGGQQEEVDKNFEATALRETYEEIGIQPENIEILGPLTPIFVYVSDFYVQPFLGFLNQQPKYVLQASEVDYIIEEKVNYLISDQSKHTIDYKIRDTVMKDMPYYKVNNDILWGATAMITAEIIQIFKEI